MKLKEFQIETIKKSVSHIYELLDYMSRHPDSESARFVLKSCTGSGKTIMLAEILRELNERDLMDEYVFVWSAPNKLHTQSLKKLSNILSDTEYKLIDIEEIESGELAKNTIIFANWEKVYQIAKKDNEEKGIRKGDFVNRMVRQGENGRNIQDVLELTRRAGLKVILVADESHQTFLGPNSQALISEVIKPVLTIEASATPKLGSRDSSSDIYRKVEAKIDEVIDSGLIKKEVLINDDLETIADELNRDAIETAVIAGLRKRAELEKEYDKLGVRINPLLCIQLPSEKETMSELDIKVKTIVEEILSDQGYEYYNKNLAIWLSDEKENLENIEEHKNTVEVLIFKQAIALGWDCPRAHVLVMLRDIKSEAFRTQTVGRILRMPEAKHYENSLLDSAYVYTNAGNTVKIDHDDQDAKNLIKHQKSLIRPGVKNIVLPDSVYLSRIDYGDLKANFKLVLEGELDLAFRVGEPDSKKERYKKIDDELEIDPEELQMPVISDVVIRDIDSVTEQNEIKTVNLTVNDVNVERIFRDVLRGFCGRFKSFARSETKIKGTLKPWFKKAGIEWDLVQRIFVCSEYNQKKMKEIFDRALDKYDTLNQREMRERRKKQDKIYDFSIPEKDEFNEHYTVCVCKKNAMVPYFHFENAPKTEILFEDLLEKSDKVEWWYKNGEKMDRYFAVKYYELNENAKAFGKAFYPDYIVKFNDGRVGIFDTKRGFTAEDKYAKQKANALQKYINEHSNLNLFGGLINVTANNEFYLNQSADYEFGDGKSGQWEKLIFDN